MTIRSLMVALLTVFVLISAIELSAWTLGRVRLVAAPSASVSDVETPIAQVPEIDAPTPSPAPVLTW